jgi:outer membrane beta-barrel protein
VKRFYKQIGLLILAFAGMSNFSFAQIAPAPVDTGLEELYDRFEDQEVRQTEEAKRVQTPREEEAKEKPKEVTKVSDLSVLAPFQDIAIIQRRFLPKTKRFEASGAATINTNNAYFNNVGIAGRFAFYFQEKIGIEGTYMFLDSSERPITKGLKDKKRISTASLVEPEAYYGVSLKWAPLYGKMAWLGEKIVPFDLYLTPGFGVTKTALGKSHTTFSIGGGQLFALTKSSGLRWDLNWNFYQAETIPDTTTGVSSKSNHSDLVLTVGYSFFFPEATYR